MALRILQNFWEMSVFYKEAIIFLFIIGVLFVTLYKQNKQKKMRERSRRRRALHHRWVELRIGAEKELREAARQNPSGRVRISGIGNEMFYAIMAESIIGQQKGCVIAKIEVRPAERFPVKISTGKESAVMSTLNSEEISKLCQIVRSFDPVKVSR